MNNLDVTQAKYLQRLIGEDRMRFDEMKTVDASERARRAGFVSLDALYDSMQVVLDQLVAIQKEQGLS